MESENVEHASGCLFLRGGHFDRTRDFEEDHLIPISIDGNPRNVRNFWPEPRFGIWNAEKKDQLEDVIHRRVCNGSIPLRAALTLIKLVAKWYCVCARLP